MDVLGRILLNLEFKAPLFSVIEMSGDVSLRMPEVANVVAFHFVSSGTCRICEGGNEHVVSAGEFVILSHGRNCRIETGRRVPALNFLDLKATQLQPDWSAQRGLEKPVRLHVGSAPFSTTILTGMFVVGNTEVKALIGEPPFMLRFSPQEATLRDWSLACLKFVVQEIESPRPGYVAMAERTLQLLMTHALREWALQDKAAGSSWGLADQKIQRAVQAIHAQPAWPWTLDELAAIAGLCRSTFTAKFAEVMSETPIAYVTKWQMHLAAIRLRTTDESITEIAESLGYRSIFAFSRPFRAHYQVTPGAYRRTERTADSSSAALQN